METTPGDELAYDKATEHLLAARKLLAHPAAHARRLADSGSPHAQSGAEEARKHVERLRSRMRALVGEVATLEENLAAAQDWHDRYEFVNGRRPTP